MDRTEMYKVFGTGPVRRGLSELQETFKGGNLLVMPKFITKKEPEMLLPLSPADAIIFLQAVGIKTVLINKISHLHETNDWILLDVNFM